MDRETYPLLYPFLTKHIWHSASVSFITFVIPSVTPSAQETHIFPFPFPLVNRKSFNYNTTRIK
jgi:hypothetical protein